MRDKITNHSSMNSLSKIFKLCGLRTYKVTVAQNQVEILDNICCYSVSYTYMYRTRKTPKIKELLSQDVRIYRTSDLALLWEITNKSTLWITISRYLKKGILHKIHKGLYSTVTINKLDKFELGQAVCGISSYISGETVLQNEGIIMQSLDKITLFGNKKKEITIDGQKFLCRYLNPKYLLNRAGIIEKNRYSIASADRALADILHINPKYYIDNKLAVDMDKVNKLMREIGYK